MPALRHASQWRLSAVADPDPGRRSQLAAAADPAARAYASVAELVEAERPDALVVASPPHLHLEHAELAARTGALVLVEKPPGLSAEEARRLGSLGRVRVGFNRRFSHLRAVARGVPATGPLELSLRISYRRGAWRPHQVSDDALADLGPHLADLAGCLLGGEIERARADEVGPRRAVAELAGPRGRAVIRCETDSPWVERVEVRDASGDIAARSVHGGIARNVASRLRGGEHPLVESLAGQLGALARVARGEDDPELAGPADGAHAMAAIEAARRSGANGGGWVAA